MMNLEEALKEALEANQALSAVVECKPVEQCECGGTVRLIKKPALHQVYDIPVPRFEITEYQIYKECCEDCGSRYRGTLPKGVSRKGYGARIHALVSLLTSKYRMSKRQVQDWFDDIYQMPVSLGSVSNIEGTSYPPFATPAGVATWGALLLTPLPGL